MMEQGYEAICRAAMADPGHRGLSSHADRLPDIAALAAKLCGVKRAVLISGFPVRTATGVVGETDGPSGITWLAGALNRLGAQVRIYTGQCCYDQIEAARAFAAPQSQLCLLPHRGGRDYARRELEDFAPDCLITLERPGRSADGTYYNMNACSISDLVADAEPLFREAEEMGIPTIAVGDGGNEMGMGRCRELVEHYVPHGQKICARQDADYTLMGGVSNWWGWGLAAAMSLSAGRDLLPTCEEETEQLRRVVASGGADGNTARHEMTVDNMPLALHLEVLEHMRKAVQNSLRDTAV